MNKLRPGYFAMLALLAISSTPAGAHNGPPFPIIEGKRVGPCIIDLWTHPDIGIGTFFVILKPLPGGSMPKDLRIEIGVQPVSGRLKEVRYSATRTDLRGQIQYGTQVNFDADEMWTVHLLLHSSSGDGEAYSKVEATPTGLGPWDLLWFTLPFLGAGFLWFRAATRGRGRKKKSVTVSS